MLMIFELMQIAVKTKKLPIIVITIVFITLSSFVVHWLEPDMFVTPFIGFWYVMTTVTTTGYGDFVPETTIGKLYGLFLYIFGIGLIGIVIGKIVEGYGMFQTLKEEGKLRFRGKGHYVIIGWSNKAKHTMNEIIEIGEDVKIVLIDSLPSTPIESVNLFYIQGDPTDKQTLEQANVQEAHAVLIFTEENEIDPVSADGKSLIIVSSVEGYAVDLGIDIYTIVEILKEKHIPNFKHANVDEFVIADEALSDLMAKSAVHKGSSKIVMKLLSRKSGVDIWKLFNRGLWKTYNDAFEELKSLEANFISDQYDFQILKKLNEPLPDDAELYVICSKDTYQNITRKFKLD
ncbi:ion transporter [Salipaludibacillus neizhouensis]|uniref:Ion transporter n=1 Tax=Salipaludibacillus neizhouensis TaxID=885475 RepID=A0A3A9KI38_9BACI|nr:potassium channel family protein [Salipaludibacillus neizhouensis]RKL67365.1 ion transporter [Salipaludibacillus neizhouensis]